MRYTSAWPIGRLLRRPERPAAVGKVQALESSGEPASSAVASRAIDVLLQIGLEFVVTGHLVMLAAFLVEPHPGVAALREYVLEAHLEHRAHAREGIDHQGDQRPVAQAHRGACGDRIKQVAGFFSCQRGRLALLERMLRPAHGAGRVGGDDLAHHKPVEEHADRGQLEFDRRSRQAALQLLDIGGDMEWLRCSGDGRCRWCPSKRRSRGRRWRRPCGCEGS